MLKKFVEISEHKCFRQFKWGDLPVLDRFNLFYGWNGTGKTTLSNLLVNLDRKTPIEKGKVTFLFDDTNLQGDQIGQEGFPLPRVKVFNHQFVENSVLSRFDRLEHIVFFGEKTVENEQLRQDTADDLVKLREKWGKLSEKKTKASNDLDTYRREQAQAIKTLLRTSGRDKFTNYDKANFEARCDAFNPANDLILGDEEKASLVATIRTDIRPSLTIQRATNPVLSSDIENIKDVLTASPTNVAIASLKDDGPLSEWVNKGLQLHQDRETKTCLFCENPLGDDRIKNLEQHFDDSFRILSQQLTDSLQSIQQLKNTVSAFKAYPTTSVYPQLGGRLNELNSNLEAKQEEILKTINAIETSLQTKQENIFRMVDVPEGLSGLHFKGERLCESVNEIQSLLEEHNVITNDFNGQVSQAKNKLEADHIASTNTTYKEKVGFASETAQDLKDNVEKTQKLEGIIKRLDDASTETAAPAEGLNDDLALYLGHEELKLTHHGKGYTISRGKAEAKDLSEGEKTAFALLYFLKSLEDHRGKLEETIVVIDDPVSSLDANAIFTAFGFIKERTEKAKQLIVLTHDFAFLNLVKGWFRFFDDGKQSRFYTMVSLADDDGKYNSITVMDKLLKDYASEYQYLFQLVKKGAEAQDRDLSELYGLPNVGRRLLEHFIAFKFPGGKGKENLIVRMKKLEMDSKTMALLNRFLNIHSHGDGIASAEHDLNLLAETPKVMQAILEVMRKEDKEHVERLEAVLQ